MDVVLIRICPFRAEQGQCAITYAAPTFSISGTGADGTLTNMIGNACTRDYVVIPGGRGDTASPTFDRYCGNTLLRPAATPAAGSVTSA